MTFGIVYRKRGEELNFVEALSLLSLDHFRLFYVRVAKERIASKSVVVFGVPEEQKDNENFKVILFETSWMRNLAPKNCDRIVRSKLRVPKPIQFKITHSGTFYPILRKAMLLRSLYGL